MRAEQAARTSYGRLVAVLASISGDIPAAEDALGDAFEQALRTWPRDGVPANPDGWLLTVARNRLRDHWKSAATRTAVPFDPTRHALVAIDEIDVDEIGDRRLELMLACAHPAISPPVRTPLMLNAVLGFTAAQIAAALAIPAPTLAARLVRAKRRISAARIPFHIPDRSVLAKRMTYLLEAIYGAYAIDWSIAGIEPRPALAHEALYLAETVTRLAPTDAEAHGLAALISFSVSRASARVDSHGQLVPLGEQDTSLWDRELIARGRQHLRVAHSCGDLGRYQLEAAIQAVHCARRDRGSTDWTALRDLHASLHALAPTLGSMTALAVVTAETDGPHTALAMLDSLGDEIARFQPAWATRAHLLERIGLTAEALAAYDKTISMTTDPAERSYLNTKRLALAIPSTRP